MIDVQRISTRLRTGSRVAGGKGIRAAPDLERPIDVVVDVEIEIDAHSLEEVVVERDEPDLNGHLQVLHPPQLLQEIDDLLVDFLGLADHQAEVGFEFSNRARSARVIPGLGMDG